MPGMHDPAGGVPRDVLYAGTEERTTSMSDDCKFNKTIVCPENNRNCDKCAWNPEVNKLRLAKVREEHTHVTSGC